MRFPAASQPAHSIAESKDEYDQRRLLSIELYLQDLLLSFAGHAAQADNYRRLVNPLLARHRHVCFITLNYDILLDLCLQPFDPLDDINDFIAHERWSLIKPHGSATWGREVPINAGPGWAMTSPAQVFRSPPAKLIDVLKDEILHRWTTSVGEVRGADGALNVLGRFPALSVPLGSEDKLVCPGTHLNFLTDKLEAVGTYDLLVIGYSGLDRSVLGLLTATSAKPRSVYVVDAGFDQALASAERLARAFGDNLRKARRVSVATGTSTFDIEGVGPIAWHADHRPFSSWAVGGPEELEIFFQQARQPRPLS
jgi:hypothetical protein